MDPNHLGNDHTTSPAENGLVDTDEACIFEPQHGICCGYCSLGLRASSGKYRDSDEGVSVPKLLVDCHDFVGVMAVAITCCAGTQKYGNFGMQSSRMWLRLDNHRMVLVGWRV
jgi:hypothetical protein